MATVGSRLYVEDEHPSVNCNSQTIPKTKESLPFPKRNRRSDVLQHPLPLRLTTTSRKDYHITDTPVIQDFTYPNQTGIYTLNHYSIRMPLQKLSTSDIT